MLGAHFEIQRRIGKVAQHRAGGGVLSGALTVEQGVTHDVAVHQDRVKHILHACEGV